MRPSRIPEAFFHCTDRDTAQQILFRGFSAIRAAWTSSGRVALSDAAVFSGDRVVLRVALPPDLAAVAVTHERQTGMPGTRQFLVPPELLETAYISVLRANTG